MIERDLYAKIKPVLRSPEAVVITGMRRVGKTTLLRAIQENIESKNTIFLDLENIINRKYFEETDYEKVRENLSVLGLDPTRQGYVFLDEIQAVKNVPSVVKYLSDHYPIKFFLSGSGSYYLKNFFSESLAGRKYIFELFPLNFSEFLRAKKSSLNLEALREKISEPIFQEIDRYYGEYLEYGGFPGVVLKESRQEKEMALQDIFSSYFQLEVVQFGDFRKVDIVRDLILLLMQRTGSKLDVRKLSSEMGVSWQTISDYLSFFESTYLIYRVRPFSRNRDSEIRRVPKLYFCDTGLLNTFARVSEGSLFENAVFLALRHKGEVNYYERKSGAEIDFILGKESAYEVKMSASEQDMRKLAAVAESLKLSDYGIVSRKQRNMDRVAYAWML